VFEQGIPQQSRDYHIKSFVANYIVKFVECSGQNTDREEVSRSSIEVFYNCFSFIQKWWILLKWGDVRYLDHKIKSMKI